MPRIQRLVLSGLVGTALAVGGCGSGKTEAKKGDKKEATKKDDADPKDGPGDLAVKSGEPDEQPADDAPAELDERVVKAASIAKKIEAEPERTDEILAEAGMDRAAYEALIYEVSQPGLAEQYRLAMAQEG